MKKGGFGSAIIQMLHELHIILPVRTLGYGNKFIDQAPQERLWRNAGIDAAGIIKGALEVMSRLGSELEAVTKNPVLSTLD